MRRSAVRLMALLTTSVLVVSSCSSPTEEAYSAPAGADQATTTETLPTTVSSTSATTTNAPLHPTLPQVDDPCVTISDLFVGRTEYTFEFEDQYLPVGIEVASEAALDDPVVVISLHAGGFPWQHTLQAWERIWPQFGPAAEKLVVFAPQADTTETPWWTKSREFNVSYLAAFFDRLESVVCMTSGPVFLTGFGQGTVAAVQAHCAGAINVELTAILLLIGMTTIDGCEPVDAVPIVSMDRFEYTPTVGPHWDGRWDMPRPVDLELTGGLAATPDDFAEWAEVYECEGPALTDELPDPGDLLDRPTTVLSHRGCRADLVAIGVAGAANNGRVFNALALNQMLRFLAGEFAQLLDDT